MSKFKYQGVITDRLGNQNLGHKTKWYLTYAEAQKAAEKLCKKYLGERGYFKIVHKIID